MPLTTFDLYRDVVAILGIAITDSHTGEPRSVHGTGFVIAPGLLITCWHCINATLPVGHQYAAAYRESTGALKLSLLSNISKDGNGADLATANLNWPFPVGLRLGTEEARTAEDVWTVGHPLTKLDRRDGELWIELSPQYLRTYVTRQFINLYGEFGETRSYELAMAAHAGLSGAPLMREDSTEVVGMIYGNHDVAQIVEFGHRDEITGEVTPSVERIISHGVAHHLSAIRNVTGSATALLTLAELVKRFEGPSSPATSRLAEIALNAQRLGIRQLCPACRKGVLEIAATGNVLVQTDPSTSGLLPCAILTCGQCGFISQHQINKLDSLCS